MTTDFKNSMEKQRLEEYYKLKIKEAFSLFVREKDKPDYIRKEEVPYVMRYLGRFPSEAQVVDDILPRIQDDEPSSYVKYSSVEAFMLKILMGEEREFEPDDQEILLAAFKVLDPDGKGYIELETLKDLMTNKGIPLKEREIDEFVKFAACKEPGKENLVYYEDYLSRMYSYVDKHLDNIMKGYANFQVDKK